MSVPAHLKSTPRATKAKGIALGLIIALPLLLELLVFNFRHWESLTYEPVAPADIRVREEAYEGGSNLVIELTGFDAPVHNVRIDPAVLSPADTPATPLTVSLNVTDAAHVRELALPETEVIQALPESTYLRLHLVGSTNRVTITIRDVSKDANTDYAQAVELNAVRPLLIRPWRIVLMALACCLVALFRPRSRLYRTPLDLSRSAHRALVGGVLAFNVLVVLAVGLAFDNSSYWHTDTSPTDQQYNYLAEALLAGHAWLDEEPPASLEDATNVYDPLDRHLAHEAAGESSILDFAYRDGKYWSYFGVVPAILFYVPHIALTGHRLSTGALVLALDCLLPPALFWLLATLDKRHRLNASLGMYCLLATVLSMSSGALYFAQIASLYSLPILCALLFGMLGVTCWLRAAPADGSRPRRGLLMAGSVLVALVMGCRPHLALVLLLAFPIFGTQIRERWFFSRRGLGNTLCVMVPFALIGAALMWYNYIRFSNPLDFGAQYNLTSSDMTHKGFDPERFVVGYWEYFFQPFTVQPKFPYIAIHATELGLATDYQGFIVNEYLTAGYFAYNTIGLFVFGLGRARRRLRERGLWGLAVLMVAIGMVVVSIDIQMVGITLRYQADFALLLMLPAVLVILVLLGNEQDERMARVLTTAVVCLAALCVLLQLVSLLADGRYNALVDTSPLVYYHIKYRLFSFLSIR